MPASTIKFKSPNACNICHEDKDARWADTWVRKWRKRDFQKPVIYVAGLVNDARKRDWSRHDEMLAYITKKDHDEIYATSLIRLLRSKNDPAQLHAILNATKDPSPLVRAAAIETLSSMPSMETLHTLIKATGDDYRLVRIRAADALSVYRDTITEMHLEEKDKRNMAKAKEEFLSFLLSRPDQWMSHYNMGNYQLESGNPQAALSSYEKVLNLDPHAITAFVNMSMAYARMGRNKEAEESLQKALEIEPENAAANFNLGLLLAEQGRMDEAEKALHNALQSDPQLAPAAYNLCVMLANDRKEEAIDYCKKANELRPDEPKYAYTLAFYQYQMNETDDAVKTLNDLLKKYPGYRDAQMLLQEISNKKHKLF
jgi:tetratricopeptide (TPR) repeat protein